MTKEEISILFNQRRTEFGTRKEFATKEIQQILDEIPYHSHPNFVSLLAKNGCLKKIRKGFYKFTVEPVFKDNIYECISLLRDLANKNQTKYRKQKKGVVENNNKTEAIANAIKLLKENGYKIIRLETIVKEIEI